MSKPLKTKVYGGLWVESEQSMMGFASAEKSKAPSVYSDGKILQKNTSFIDYQNHSTQAHSAMKSFENSRISDGKIKQ